MAFQSVPDTAEAVINWVSDGQPAINRINFEKTGGYDQVAIDLLASVIDAAVADYLIPLVSAGATYLFTKVRGLENQVDLEATNATSTEGGAASGNALPPNVSYTTQFGTGATGRTARGRFYWVALSQSSLADIRNVATIHADACVDALADLIDDAASAGWTAVITSRQLNNVVRPTGVNRTITDVIARNTNLDTQRRRVGK